MEPVEVIVVRGKRVAIGFQNVRLIPGSFPRYVAYDPQSGPLLGFIAEIGAPSDKAKRAKNLVKLERHVKNKFGGY